MAVTGTSAPHGDPSQRGPHDLDLAGRGRRATACSSGGPRGAREGPSWPMGPGRLVWTRPLWPLASMTKTPAGATAIMVMVAFDPGIRRSLRTMTPSPLDQLERGPEPAPPVTVGPPDLGPGRPASAGRAGAGSACGRRALLRPGSVHRRSAGSCVEERTGRAPIGPAASPAPGECCNLAHPVPFPRRGAKMAGGRTSGRGAGQYPRGNSGKGEVHARVEPSRRQGDHGGHRHQGGHGGRRGGRPGPSPGRRPGGVPGRIARSRASCPSGTS